MSQPTDTVFWRRGLVIVVVLAVILGVGIFFLLPARNQHRSSSSTSQPVQTSASKVVAIPGLNNVSYQLGSVDKMAALRKTGQACAYWSRLSESLKRGLAFVDAKVLPSCVPHNYIATAKAEHRARNTQRVNQYNGSRFDLGNPDQPEYYSGYTYSCSSLTQWTRYDYAPPKVPKDLFDDYNLANEYASDPTSLTPAQNRAIKKYNDAETAFNKYQSNISGLVDMYVDGGNFDKDCYPPGMIVGANQSVTFYPNHPVNSLREAAAPVFSSPGGSNTTGLGIPYTIKPGDSPASVASLFYGFDGEENWPLIVAANHIGTLTSDRNNDSGFTLNTATLKWVVGQVIYLPDASAFSS